MKPLLDSIIKYIESFHSLTYKMSHAHWLPIQIVSIIAILVISLLLFFYVKSAKQRYIALGLLIFINLLFLLFGVINIYHWGVSFWEYAADGPGFILGMDLFYFFGVKTSNKRIIHWIMFIFFLLSAIIFTESFILSEILPANVIDWTIQLTANSSTALSSEQQKAASLFEEMKWTTISSIHDIDDRVLNALKSRFGRDDRLADVAEPFNPSDVLDERPERRLVLAGHAGNLWFILYERGGYGLHLILVVFDAKAQPPNVTFSASGTAGTHVLRKWRVNVQNIVDALRTGHLSVYVEKHQYF